MVHMSSLRCNYDLLRVQPQQLYPKCSQTDSNRTLFYDSVAVNVSFSYYITIFFVFQHKTDVLLRETPNDNSSVCQPQTMENKSIILDCSGITFFDFMGISMLTKICLELKGCGTNVLLARCHVSLVKALQSSELGTSDHHFFDSVNSALSTIQPEMSHELNWDALVSSDV
ncbi:anion exchange transporter-like [Bombina bombina]|uniref:anion exchange transporter-like n=1 Tax=Bombina bombina TaxID=8345 RepID=UPI00235A933C|nr:anion exchange transporter-like [Bombina bombina]